MNLTALQAIKLGLILVVLAWLMVEHFWKPARTAVGQKWCNAILVAIAFLSVFAYFDFGQYLKFGVFKNYHDLYHYYMGSKYSTEIGYNNLYPATVVAAAEQNGKPIHKAYRRMDDYSFAPAASAVQQADQLKASFTPDRWNEFKQDVAFFQAKLRGRFRTVVEDMGYNATPVWNMVGHVITNRFPTSNPFSLDLLVALDLVLLAMMTACVWSVFDGRTALLALIFFCTSFWMSYTHIRGGFLRLDWIMALVFTLCAIKTGHYRMAGALMGYAGMARVFPFIFVFGMGAKWVWDMYQTRSFNRRYMEFFLSLGLASAVLVGVSMLSDGGIAHWRDFFAKIGLHNNHMAPVRVGFKCVFLMTYENTVGSWPAFKAAKMQQMENWKWLWWTIQGAMLLVSFWAARRLEDHESIAYGYVPAYFLTAPTFYYHIMILSALFFFLPKRAALDRLGGVALFFGVSAGLLFANRFMPLDLQLSFLMACLLLVCTLYMMAIACLAKPSLSAQR